MLRYDTTGRMIDVVWDGGLVDNEAGPDIITSVIISLFSDGRATIDAGIPDHERRGYWGDVTLGSRIWLAFREPLTQQNMVGMQQSAEAALAWMIADKVASSVDVTVERISRSAVKLAVVVYEGDGVLWSGAWKVTKDQVEQLTSAI